jgi:integrase
MGILTAVAVRTLRTEGRYADGHGLFLNVVAPEKRYWLFRYQRAKRAREMSFGSADVVTLAEARRLHAEARALLARGLDPLEARRAAEPQHGPTFVEAVKQYVEDHRASWRGRDSAGAWEARLINHTGPVFGAKPVGRVDVDDVLKALRPIWTNKAPTAALVRARIETMLDYAKARGWRSGENPARWRGHLQHALPAPGRVHTTVHRAAMPWQELPTFMQDLRKQDSMAARCLEFLILTAVRSAEARGCTWDEIDLDQGVWSIPAQRTKSARLHRVPLSEPALAILSDLAAIRSVEPLVFLGRVGRRPLNDVTLTRLLRQLVAGSNYTVHGFRSAFRDWCSDNGKPDAAAEAALAHAAPGKTIGAYARSDLLDRRRELMAAWAGFLEAPRGIVVPLRKAG